VLQSAALRSSPPVGLVFIVPRLQATGMNYVAR
jgi:hypothetical protein